MPAAHNLGVYPYVAEQSRWVHKTILLTKSAKYYDSEAPHCIFLPSVTGH